MQVCLQKLVADAAQHLADRVGARQALRAEAVAGIGVLVQLARVFACVTGYPDRRVLRVVDPLAHDQRRFNKRPEGNPRMTGLIRGEVVECAASRPLHDRKKRNQLHVAFLMRCLAGAEAGGKMREQLVELVERCELGFEIQQKRFAVLADRGAVTKNVVVGIHIDFSLSAPSSVPSRVPEGLGEQCGCRP